MTDDEITQLVQATFGDVPRPDRFTECTCDECVELNNRFCQRDNASLTSRDFGISSLSLVSAEGIRYFMPAFVRLALSDDEANGDFADDFINWFLATPISRREPPRSLPQTRFFDRKQTAATLAFLEHIHNMPTDDSGWEDRQLNRAVRNWRHFLSCFDDEGRACAGGASPPQ